jgi:hypothetical protein
MSLIGRRTLGYDRGAPRVGTPGSVGLVPVRALVHLGHQRHLQPGNASHKRGDGGIGFDVAEYLVHSGP